jgi:hypothetical protein
MRRAVSDETMGAKIKVIASRHNGSRIERDRISQRLRDYNEGAKGTSVIIWTARRTGLAEVLRRYTRLVSCYCGQGKGEIVHKYGHANFIVCALMLSLVACSRSLPNFVAIDPLKRQDTWALQRADIDCKAQVGSERWAYRWRLRYRADTEYISCMHEKGFVEASTHLAGQ